MTKIETTQFKRLIGVWKTTGEISTQNQVDILRGTDTYELILDGNFILHKADVIMGNQKSETFEMISITGTEDEASMQYFNAKGEAGLMTGRIVGNDYRINGDGIKFIGTINEENAVIVGNWFLQAADKTWMNYMNIQLEKIG